jgi:hypothetical protein
MDEKLEQYSDESGVYKDWELPEIEFMTKKDLSDFQEMVSLRTNLATLNANPYSQVMRVFRKSEPKDVVLEKVMRCFQKAEPKKAIMEADEYEVAEDDEYDEAEDDEYDEAEDDDYEEAEDEDMMELDEDVEGVEPELTIEPRRHRVGGTSAL